MGIGDRELLHLSCEDMLFAHWAIEPESLRSCVPNSLTVDTFDERAWVSIVPFKVTAVRLQASEASLPIWRPFLNLNLRTYVQKDGDQGIYFLSSDIESGVAALIGHRLFGFSVHRAKMRQRNRNKTVTFRSERTDLSGRRECFKAHYEPAGEPFQAEPSSIEEFLIEQSKYYIAGESGRSSTSSRETASGSVRTGEITHSSHRLQPAKAKIQLNTLFENLGLEPLTDQPLLHCCEQWDATWDPLRSASTL
jgi:uncharacterized protein YqjF (DUF2071 family)